MPAPIPAYNRPLPPGQGAAEPPPEPTFLQGMAATFRTGRDDQAGHMQDERANAYGALAGALIDMGNPAEKYLYPVRSGNQMNEQDIWSDVQAAKVRDPKLFSNVPLQRSEFDNQWQAKMRARQQGDALTVSRTGWTPWLIGSFGAGLTDPLTIATLPFGGASGGLVRTMARDATINSILSAAQQPMIAGERRQQGRDYTARDFLTNMALAPVIGAGFGALAHGAKVSGGQAYDAVSGSLGNAVAANWDRLSPGLQDRIMRNAKIGGGSVDDWLLADTAHAIVGEDAMSGGDGASISVLRREGQIDATSPFEANGAGLSTHRSLLSATVARILAEDPSARKPSVASGPLSRSTALSSGTVSSDPAAIFAERLGAVESGNNNWAVPRDPATGRPLSSAMGKFQFTKGLWLTLYKDRFGDGGLNDADILAKRSSGQLQSVLLGDATQRYTSALRGAGEPVTPGNLYVMHFAGETGGAKLFRAAADTPAREVLGEAAVKANPFLEKMTAGDVLAWADRKMGGSGTPARGNGLELAAGAGDDVALTAQMQRDLDALRLENAQRRAALLGSTPAMEDVLAVGERATPIEGAEAAPLPDAPPNTDVAPAPLEPRAMDADAPPSEVMAIMPQLREIIGDRKRSLNDLDGIAKELGVTEGQVRQALTSLVAEGGISQRKSGNFQRSPAPMSGPEDVLDFIARHGGIRDNEGHSLGLRSLPPEERVGLNRQQIKAAEARRRTGSRDWQRMTRRNGQLLRHSGRSVDQVGEKLWEGGYLKGRDGGRPTTREVLDYLDQRILDGKQRFPVGEGPVPDYAELTSQWGEEGVPDSRADPTANHPLDQVPEPMRAEMQRFASDWLGVDDIRSEIDPWIIDRAMDLWHEHGADRSVASAFEQAILDHNVSVAHDAREATGNPAFDEIPFDIEPATGRADRPGEGDHGGRDSAGASASEGGTFGRPDAAHEDPGPQLSDLPHEEVTRFLDPQGEAATAQTENLVHDAQAALEATDAMHENLPPIEPDMVRMWRGGSKDEAGRGGWYTSSRSYAEGYAQLNGGDLWYMDIRRDHAIFANAEEGQGPERGFTFSGDFGPEHTGRRVFEPVADPAVAERQREQARLQAEAPLRGENRTGQAQDGTMGLGLFDAADQPTFRLDDEGPEMTLNELLAEYDKSQADMDTMRSCMVPMKPKIEE